MLQIKPEDIIAVTDAVVNVLINVPVDAAIDVIVRALSRWWNKPIRNF